MAYRMRWWALRLRCW